MENIESKLPITTKTVDIEDFKDENLYGEIAYHLSPDEVRKDMDVKAIAAVTKLASLVNKVTGHASTEFIVSKNFEVVSKHFDLKLAIQKYNEL